MAGTENPYLPPTSDLTDATHVGTADIVASRMKRLGAVLLDFTILMALFLAVSLIAYVSDPGEFQREFSSAMEEDASWFEINLLNGTNYIGLATTAAAFFAINGYLLAKRGQSIGKFILSIAIVDVDTGSVQPFGRLVMLRFAPIYMLQVLMNFVYFLVFMVDALLIFRSDRRTLHDIMAGTTVIDLKLQERLRRERKGGEIADSIQDDAKP